MPFQVPPKVLAQDQREANYKQFKKIREEKGTKKTRRMTAIIMVKFPPGSRIYKYAKHMLQTWQHRSLEELLEDARDELMVFESESEGGE
ncbi:unnamed protein product [Symbiodinium necroappetens]|uniref:Uncharacterized protein n=1 Tax=Symbiodinium necroappetens TaxID=1628268 RepID=A0A813CAN6_9DINO|nr:unnamed protein product [Symbiodinium necroappetens]